MATTNVRRRQFLTVVGVGSAAAAAAVATGQGGEVGRKPAAAQRQGKGYQLTEHVQNYYRTAKV
jgi:hypothetical protein